MKKLSLLLILFALFNNGKAQIAHSTIKVYSDFICNCIDTVDFNQPEDALKKKLQFCRTISLTNILNDRLISPEVFTNEKLAKELSDKSITYLSDSCDAVQRMMEALSKEPEFEKTNDEEIFIPESFFETYGLRRGETNDRLHVYNNLEKVGKPKMQRAVDIRWTFSSEADALKWHEMNLEKNSENGAPVKDKIIIPGTTDLKVFREAPGSAELMKALGIEQRHHYFIFVYKNIVCKIFVATDEKTNTSEVMPFAIAAVAQLQKIIK